ncbi:MAG: EamA family transporter [Leptolyngbyaceae cyanobacterium SM1_1_3]|nr:EamA family transporter [Leptolyngbyaceae cyanobacterium SM1_1_3]NJN02772.1 EamA family transporter [Leptolyngbyaceae cyanobacterium RM1_1_2]
MSHSRFSATLIGFSAVLMWATLAVLTTLTDTIPPFQLTAMAFTIAFGIGLVLWLRDSGPILRHLKLPWPVWCLGITGLFGYHFLYFMALRQAPAIEASLIAYLWPLLIVLLSALLPGETLQRSHLLGAALGFVGAGLLVTGGKGFALQSQYSLGYLLALLCAFTWSGYSVLSRRFGAIPTSAVGGFCGVTALLAWLCHFLGEPTLWPTGQAWLAILGLGLGPVGLAFFTWDYGVKHGDIRLLGVLSYAAPLLSTLLLILCGLAEATWTVAIACLLIVLGAAIATLPPTQSPQPKS